MSAPSRVSTDLYRVDTTVTGTEMPLALYLLGSEGWLVTDTGCVGMIRDLLIPAARALRPGSHIERAVVTHAHGDHFGGNAELLAAEPGCTIFVHRRDEAWAREPDWHVRDAYGALWPDYPCPPEVSDWVRGLLGSPAPVVPIETAHTFDLDDGRSLHTIFLPGHSPGHIGLWEPEERVLLFSDAILGSGQEVAGKVVAIPAYLDVDAYLASIRTIRALSPDLSCPSHFPVMDGATTQAFCDESETFVHEFDAIICELLSEGAATLRDLASVALARAAPDADLSVAAAMTVQAHLDALHRHGVATWRMEKELRIWEAV